MRHLSSVLRLPGAFTLLLEPIHRRLGRYPIATLATSVGPMRLDLRDYNQRRIFYNSHEVRETRFLRRFIRTGDVVVDIGANVGYFTLLASSAVGRTGCVYSFEPVPANFELLTANVALNGLRNVSAVAAAAGRAVGVASFGIPRGVESDLGDSSAMYMRGGSERQVEAEVIVPDAYLGPRLDDRPVRLVKIDVEGVEPDVLAGIDGMLGRQQADALLVEVNENRLRDHGFEQADVLHPLERHGYQLFRLAAFGVPRRLEAEWGRGRALFNVLALAPRIPAARDR